MTRTMTRTELEQFYISNIRMYARIIARNPIEYYDRAVELLSKDQERLVNEFGWDWEQVEQLEISAYKAEIKNKYSN